MPLDSDEARQLADVRAVVIQQLLQCGRPLRLEQIAELLAMTNNEVIRRLHLLEETRRAALHPDKPELWVIHRYDVFSAIAT